MILIKDIKLPISHNEEALLNKIKKLVDYSRTCNGVKKFEYEIYKQSIDARRRPDIFYIYSVYLKVDSVTENNIKKYVYKRKVKNISFDNVIKYSIPEKGNIKLQDSPVVIGSGPAGLFAAYILSQRGFNPIVIERGEEVDKRTVTVEKTFETGLINIESNVQFGEGGAGTFSDGKLNTLTKDINGRNTYVLKTFNECGAPNEITYVSKPHIGTDVLKGVVKNLRNKIIENGGSFLFDTRFDDFEVEEDRIKSISCTNTRNGNVIHIDTSVVLLCTGHSARDTFEMLYKKKVYMESKNFAVGFRVQHPQRIVNEWQYGVEDTKTIGLGAADYKVTNEAGNGRKVYSFCMCPGGYVVNSSSELEQMCVNGMSESGRDSAFANSAIICGIEPKDFIQEEVELTHPLSGMYYQRKIEREAFVRGGAKGKICGQYFADFEKNVPTEILDEGNLCTKGAVNPGNLRGIFSDEIDEAIIESIHRFGSSRNGFDADDTIMYGIEARTSSPVRIVRNEELETNIKGLYPCGEGAGYAGGITSAAADGLRVAEKVISKYRLDIEE